MTMVKKITFEQLPAAVGKILELLSSEGSGQTSTPELIQRMTLLESKIDYLQQTLAPDRPVMDMQEVCRVLKLRPKAVNELAVNGVLPSRSQGKRTVFYKDGVVSYFMGMPAWKSALSASESEPVSVSVSSEDDVPRPVENRYNRIDIHAAAKILNRSMPAIYQLINAERVPYHKDGRKVYFISEELYRWAASHPPKPRKKKWGSK